MTREINYIELSRVLRRYYAQNINSVNFISFNKAVSTFLTKPEAHQLFMYYIEHDKVIVPKNTKQYRFNCRQDHFDADAVRHLFVNGYIKISPRKIAYKSKKMKNHPVTPITKMEEAHTTIVSPKDLSDSDLETAINTLLAEKKRRETIKKLNSLISDLGLTKEELKQYLND